MLDEVVIDTELAAWFAATGRVLEVRAARSPWQILVVEVMSQQTQIERVGPYWRQFVERWPTPALFATATTREVLDAWAGLGYNRRPLALRDAARRIVAVHGGEVPSDVDALEALPGVGRYTARAVAAAAFGQPVAPVDVNVRRVIGRLAGVDRLHDVQAEADRLISREHPAAWIHAVMDLAVSVCVRRAPACDECPIAEHCASRGTPGELPPVHGRGPRHAGANHPARTASEDFEASNRWLRGRILRVLRAGAPGSWLEFTTPLGEHGIGAVHAALAELESEGFLERDGQLARLPST